MKVKCTWIGEGKNVGLGDFPSPRIYKAEAFYGDGEDVAKTYEELDRHLESFRQDQGQEITWKYEIMPDLPVQLVWSEFE